MSEISLYEAQIKKMQGLCEEHDLIYRFKKDSYPITFTIKPAQDIDAQMSMLENVEEAGYRSPDASMTWVFKDGVLETTVRGGVFTISKVLRAKIESILIKMIAYWQQFFFREIVENKVLSAKDMPDIGNNGDPFPEAEPLESFGDTAEDGTESEPYTDPEDDEITNATRIIRAYNSASIPLLQREMNITSAKASAILDALESLGVIETSDDGSSWEVLPCDEPEDEEAAGDPA